MKHLSALLLTLMASPAFAASGPFFSLYNTNFVVTVAFIGFVALVLYLGVPKMLGKMLDARADGIRAELEEARSLREEAKALLASSLHTQFLRQFSSPPAFCVCLLGLVVSSPTSLSPGRTPASTTFVTHPSLPKCAARCLNL